MDWITAFQNIYGRVKSPWMFAFNQEIYDHEGRRRDPLREKQTRWGMRLTTRLFSRVYPGIPGRVHIHETMLQNDGPEELNHYRRVGQDALRNIEESLRLAGRDFGSIERCLDMACGYGRVLRWLAQRMPARRITACEVIPEAVRFCRQEFGARPLLAPLDPNELVFPERYDLIWVGSLLTHLRPEAAMRFAHRLVETLNPGGVLVFSSQGPSCLAQIPMYGFMFADKTEVFREQLDAVGAAFLPYYAHEPDYGITLLAPAYVRAALPEDGDPPIRLLRHAERGWDNHQDVWSFQRLAPPSSS